MEEGRGEARRILTESIGTGGGAMRCVRANLMVDATRHMFMSTGFIVVLLKHPCYY